MRKLLFCGVVVLTILLASCVENISSCPVINGTQASVQNLGSSTVVCSYVGSVTCPDYFGWTKNQTSGNVGGASGTICTWKKIL